MSTGIDSHEDVSAGSAPRRLKAILWIALPCAIVGGPFWFYHQIDGTIRDAYAQEWVGGMVITHLENNEGRWPRNWDDLQQPYEIACIAVGGRPWTFEELRGRVDVDFSADPEALSKTQLSGRDPPFRVINLRSGRRTHWEGFEANYEVWKTLQKQYAVDAKVGEGEDNAN